MRVDYREVFPAGIRAMAELERAVRSATLDLAATAASGSA